VRDSYRGGAHELALLYASFWAACFVSAALLSRLGGLQRPGRGLILAHLASAVALACFALKPPLWALYLVVAGWGLVSGVAISTNRSIIQALTKPAYLGRVLALYSMGFMGGAPIGGMLAGISADKFEPRVAALAPALGLACASLLLAFFTPVWSVARPETESLN
jgi:MFS family permease